MKKYAFAMLCIALLSPPAFAQRVDQMPSAAPPELAEGIAAVVNDAIVTKGDVRARLKLALLSSNLPDNEEMRARLLPQVLRSLIEEQLQVQEGKKLGLSVAGEEISGAMQKIANDNNVPGGDMTAFLRAHDISPSTLRAQIEASLLWSKVVMREIRPRIDIGEQEIDAAVRQLKDNAGKQEYLVSEIFLAVDEQEDESAARAFADKLVEQIKGGASFGAVARQFSQGAGAAAGGDIGWIRAGELGAGIDDVLTKLNPGEIAGPVRAEDGFHILGLRDKRIVALGDPARAKIRLAQAFGAVSDEADKRALLEQADRLRRTVNGCDDVAATVEKGFPSWHWQELGEIETGTAPSWLAERIDKLNEGGSDEPMATEKGVLVLFLCERIVPDDIDRDAIRNAIGTEKMERMARRFLRDVRRDAFLDIRLKGTP